MKIPIMKRLTFGDVINLGFSPSSTEEQRKTALKAKKTLNHAVCDVMENFDKWYQRDGHFVPIKVGEEHEEMCRDGSQLWIKDVKGMHHPSNVQGLVTVSVMESIIRSEQLGKYYPYST